MEGMTPVTLHSQPESYLRADVDALIVKMINSDSYFNRRASKMSKDSEKAIKELDKMQERVSGSIKGFLDKERAVSESIKKTTGQLRDSANKLGQGISNITKITDFNQLERYVLLLERAELAMNGLSKLQDSGKLNKIIEAIK